MRIRFVDLAGIRTRYYESGAGEPVIFIHGGGAAADTWARNVEATGTVAHAFAPDLMGHGFTDAPDLTGLAPQKAQVDHLFRFLDILGLRGCTLVGSAYGALFGVLMYFQRPELVKRLVLVGSGSIFDTEERQADITKASVSNQMQALDDPTPAAIRRRNIGSNFNKGDTFEEIVLLQLTALSLPGRKEAYRWMTGGIRAAADRPEYQVAHRLEEIAVPTLVVSGRDDPRADWHRVTDGAARIPQAQLHILEQCGHKPFSERADQFNKLLADFLTNG